MAEKLNQLALGYAAATLSAVCMLLLGILGNMGIYKGAVEMMQQWQIFFSLSIGGIIAGIVEAAIIGFIFGYAFGWLYNKFA
jgi:heme/copper-type cytochrome/quinol oxidase subunit 2